LLLSNPHQVITKSFESGVKFAQRWISVDDELPEEGVLVQVKYIHPAGVQYTHDYIEEDIDDESGKHFKAWHDDYGATHWRPIELK